MVNFWLFIFALNLWTSLFCYLLIYNLVLITSKQDEKASVRVCREKTQFGKI